MRSETVLTTWRVDGAILVVAAADGPMPQAGDGAIVACNYNYE